MKIGIYSKFVHPGGSERRSAYMCTFIKQLYPEVEVVLLSESTIHPEIQPLVIVPYILNAYETYDFSSLSHIIIVNSDSKKYSLASYWGDKLKDVEVSILYNFMARSPYCQEAVKLNCKNLKFLLANNACRKYFDYAVPGCKCEVIESIVDPTSYMRTKSISDIVRIGRHAFGTNYKFSPLYRKVIEKYKDKVKFDIMGYPPINLPIDPNVTFRPSLSMDVGEYLTGIDIFLTCTHHDLTEAWSRSNQEAMISGCAMLCVNAGGNKDQVRHGVNGYLYNGEKDLYTYLDLLIQDNDLRKEMYTASKFIAAEFSPDKIITKLMRFIC
jgi:glycosyltransferase involved in cell wall biosynthesis